LRPEYPDHVWSYDFVSERTHDGRAFQILNLIDEYTQECLAIRAERNLDHKDVQKCLAGLFYTRGIPIHFHYDSRPVFISTQLRQWLTRFDVKTLFIEPGSPWENGYIESFNDKMRDELLDRGISPWKKPKS
jgi:putative transposase